MEKVGAHAGPFLKNKLTLNNMSTYSAKEMIDFASWFQSAFKGANTEPTLNDLKTWEEGKEDLSGRND